MVESIGHEFMRRTRYSELSASPQESGIIPQPPLELPVHSGAELITLPKVEQVKIPPMDLREAIGQRRTLRKYAEDPLTLEELTYLLWVSQGVEKISSRPSTMRTVPSAGARHAFETILLVNRVESLRPGLYRYVAIENQLEVLPSVPEITEVITAACLNQSQITGSAVTLLWVAVVERMFWRYVERGYRYLHLDAGHACENLALGAQQLGCGICPMAAFDDDKLNQALGLDGESQFVIYMATVGKRI